MGGGGKDTMTPTGNSSATNKFSSTPNTPSWLTNMAQNQLQYGQTNIDAFKNMSINPQQVAPMSPWEQQGYGTLTDYANNPAYQQGMGEINKSLSGDYLYGGPAQQAFIDANMRMAAPGIFSAWGSANRSGGQLGKLQLGQVAADAYAGLYGSERDKMQQNVDKSMNYGQLPAQLQTQAGAVERGITDAQNAADYQAQMARLAQAQSAAQMGLQSNQMLPSYMGMYGTNTTSSDTGSTSQLLNEPSAGQNILGGAMAGAGAGSAFGFPGMAIGGVGGGILGAFQ